MEAFRLVRKKYAMPLSGKGAALKGGRWNFAGSELLYLASNRSLAMAEVAVHLTLATIPTDLVMMTISIPGNVSIEVINASELPTGWNSFPYVEATRAIGDAFLLNGRACILKVPSAVTKGDYNLLANPHHNEFKGLKVLSMEAFPFDGRIFK
ncbi:MAG TPA: RES family NAD+ phosphorylase [Pyrinomonadaceae bacterium]|nr:RES family NAD+ phosphorylase [Pyrinomonadaceae bacterium]